MASITTSISTINAFQILQANNPDPSYASTMVIYQNGIAIASGVSSAATLASTIVTAPLYINGRAATTTNSVPMYLAEVLLFNAPLTSTQRTQVESYLAQKWTLTTSLPAGHINFTRPAGIPATTSAIVRTVASLAKNQATLTLDITTTATMSWVSTVLNVTSYSWVLYQSATNAYAGTVIESGTTTSTSASPSSPLASNNYYYFLLLTNSSSGSYLSASSIIQYISNNTLVVASGGTATTAGANTVRSFTTTGANTFTLTSPASISVTYLVVAGGGGGGVGRGGVGGAGGVIT